MCVCICASDLVHGAWSEPLRHISLLSHPLCCPRVPLQVDIPCAGNITIAPSCLFQCPVASNFLDTFDGLYGPDGAYPVSSLYCSAAPYAIHGIVYLAFTEVLVSTLQFQCQPCPLDTYSLFAGSGSGDMHAAVRFAAFWRQAVAAARSE